MSLNEFYTFSQVAKLARVSTSSVWRWHLTGVKGRKLDSFLLGGRRYVTRQQLEKFCSHISESETQSDVRQKIASQRLDARGVQK